MWNHNDAFGILVVPPAELLVRDRRHSPAVANDNIAAAKVRKRAANRQVVVEPNHERLRLPRREVCRRDGLRADRRGFVLLWTIPNQQERGDRDAEASHDRCDYDGASHVRKDGSSTKPALRRHPGRKLASQPDRAGTSRQDSFSLLSNST
jgi:hypothetical protein